MLKLLVKGMKTPRVVETGPDFALPDGTVWIDLLNPSRAEELAAETALGLQLPTREEMAEIETSSRLYREDGAVFMTASLMANSDTRVPRIGPVTFVIAGHRLVTIRYIEPRAFDIFCAQVERSPHVCPTGVDVFFGLMDAIIDRIADVLEHAVVEVDALSATVFSNPRRIDFRAVMNQLGRSQDVNSKIRESAATLARMLIYAIAADQIDEGAEARERLESLQRDLASVTDHSGYLTGKVTFLLDAALGLINVEQNAIIKIFSVAAVVFLPPTLVASYFGMNFRHMAVFDWPGGEWLAVGLMLSSVVAPLWWFRRKGWL